MAKVYNWQIGREMDYPYEDARPQKQASALALGLAVFLAPALGFASPVTYTVTGGAITTIQLFALSGAVQPCPIGGGVNCLVNAPLAIDFGSITLDEGTLTLSNATITAGGTGSLQLGGMFGYTGIDFSSTTFQSAGASSLSGTLGNYSFNAPGSITTDLVLNTVGGPIALPGTVLPATPTGSINISGNQLFLNLQGVNLGMVCDPQNPTNCVIAKADFQLTASSPIPEPSAFAAFSLGLVVLGAAARRIRNSKPQE